MKKITMLSAAILTLILFIPASLNAEGLTPSLLYGYRIYFHYHPPKDKPIKSNLYPFAGPIISGGEDIPVCAAAKTEAAYARKAGLKYMVHGKDGWIFRTIDFRTDFKASPKAMEYFSRLNRALSAKGQTLVVAFQPPRAMISAQHTDSADVPAGYTQDKALQGYKDFLQQLDDADITAADLSEGAADIAYFSKGDFHWAPEGAKHSARKVAEEIQKIPAYKGIENQDFESEIAGVGPAIRGAFEEFIQNTCKINIELTTSPLWATSSKMVGAGDSAGLFGDVRFPAVTVLGTSNSSEDDKFNFVGSLKHFMHADAYNAAITSGGFGSSSYRYYASDEYHEHPPKIIVWEFLPQHNYNSIESLNSFRQMIPAVYGACSQEKALASYSGEIKNAQTDIFPLIESQSLKNTYLYLEATDPVERSVKVEILYKNGDADQVDMTRSTRAGNNGKYYLELGDWPDDNALFIHVITDTPRGSISARICPYPLQVAEK